MTEQQAVLCVRCSKGLPGNPAECPNCRWPLSVEAWSTTDHTLRRVTIDACCVNARHQDPCINALEAWDKAGIIQLERADVLLEELTGDHRRRKMETVLPLPRLFTWNVSRWDMGDVWAGPDLTPQVQHILFPTTPRLSRNQTNEVRHLTAHIRAGGHAFLTLDTSDFIKRGKQKRLAKYGIWVFTPPDLTSIIDRQLKGQGSGGA